MALVRKPSIHLVATVLVVIIMLSLMLGAGEIFLRFRANAWPFDDQMAIYAHMTDADRTLRWRFPPGKGRNHLGFRNREVVEKTNQLRVLFLGDSLVYSGDTSTGELFTQVIERNLNNLTDDTQKPIEVINLAVPGYTTYQELELLRIYGLETEPDLVLLGFVFNDVYYPYLHRPTLSNMLSIEPYAKLHRFDTTTFPKSLLANSFIAHHGVYLMERIKKKILQGDVGFRFDRRDDFYLAWRRHGWPKTEELIGEMKDLLATRHVGFAMVIFPISEQLERNWHSVDEKYVRYPLRKIKDICEAYRLLCLDLTEPLLDNGGADLYRDYLHLNEKGNDVVAGEVTRFLLENAPTLLNTEFVRPSAATNRGRQRDMSALQDGSADGMLDLTHPCAALPPSSDCSLWPIPNLAKD